jgi:uncharacterized protein
MLGFRPLSEEHAPFTTIPMQRCPSCRSPVRPPEENRSFPFCSPRCRAVDLGRWFTGSYRVAGAKADEAPHPPSDREDE